MSDGSGAVLVCSSGPRAGMTVALDEAKPARLPVRRDGNEVGQVVIQFHESAWQLVNHSPVAVEVGGHQVTRTILHDGDVIQIGPLAFQAKLPAAANERPTGRVSKRISASRDAVVTEPEQQRNSKLLKKVGSVFKRRDERQERLDSLRAERDALLREAGRDALTAQGGFGLPQPVFADLVVGRPVAIQPESLDERYLERFRERSRQLGLLDATIGVLCAELGLPPDEETGGQPVRLATEDKQFEEEAHRAMDAAQTENLDDLVVDDVEDEAATARVRMAAAICRWW